jgi:hypothetical protein
LVSLLPKDLGHPPGSCRAAPHATNAGANIVLGAVFINAVAGHSYTYSWNYGDGNSSSAAATTNFNHISPSHTYAIYHSPKHFRS